MAQSHAAVHSYLAVRRAGPYSIRATVLVCVVLICGSFAAAAALQMRNDRVHALAQAEYFEAQRAGDIAASAASSLERISGLGRAFVDGKQIGDAAEVAGIHNLTSFDRNGRVLSTFSDKPAMPLPLGALQSRKIQIRAPAIMTFPYAGRMVAVAFDPHALIPARMLERAALTTDDGAVLIQGSDWAGVGPAIRITNWPVVVRTSVDEGAALSAWTGSLPLYLFVILGPALVGAGLASVFVGEFERRARANKAIRTLKTMRPVETKLLVRLAEAERRAAEDARAKSEFITHMSHELRTPLNAIIGFSEVIERGFFGPVGHAKYSEYAHDIGDAGRDLHGKIGDILEFANIEAGRYPVRPEVINVASIVSTCASESGGRAFSRGITLQPGAATNIEALADPLAVKRIVSNLLSNALLYTQEGGHVRLDVREEEGAIVVTITDNGLGFTRAESATAGIPFRRYDRPGSMTGVGMGLTIAMALARRIGGAVRIGSLAGEGTVAELRLPKI